MPEHVQTAPSVVLTDATVHSVQRLTPAFVRVELASEAFEHLGEEGFDTRFKVVLPGPTGQLPTIPPVAEDYYAAWLGAPDDVRSPMRTYTIRDVVRDEDGVRLVVDFVVHEEHGDNADLGPACRWALGAQPGDVIVVDAGGDLTNSLMGELMLAHAVRRGVAGFVLNGAIRDADAFRAAAARLGVSGRAVGTVNGFNYSGGDEVSLTLYAPPPRNGSGAGGS